VSGDLDSLGTGCQSGEYRLSSATQQRSRI